MKMRRKGDPSGGNLLATKKGTSIQTDPQKQPVTLDYSDSNLTTTHRVQNHASNQKGPKMSKILKQAIFMTVMAVISSCDSKTNGSTNSPIDNNPLGTQSLEFGIPWNQRISYDSILDERDGQSYKTVVIGTQKWMAENLNFQVDSSWWPSNIPDSGIKYGRLYQWASALALPDTCNVKHCLRPSIYLSDSALSAIAVNVRGVCPIGWHIPSKSEWALLFRFLEKDSSSQADYVAYSLKSQTGWPKQKSNQNGSDKYGFRLIPAGARYGFGGMGSSMYGRFIGLGSEADFISATEGDWALGNVAYSPMFFNRGIGYENDPTAKINGFSVRCISD
ncbi:MAG: hypothetical protein IPO40_05590 [Fibrobacteres bacterium]|nr:hypothetical protein [Fibrobacterota bacterium]